VKVRFELVVGIIKEWWILKKVLERRLNKEREKNGR